MPATHRMTSIKELPGKELAKGVVIKPLAGEHVMLNYVQLAAGSGIAPGGAPVFWAGRRASKTRGPIEEPRF